MVYVFLSKEGHQIETDGKTKKEALDKVREICRDIGVDGKIDEPENRT